MWICGIVKSELYGIQDNTIVPLICGLQSIGKTTFTRSILPPQLSGYYSEEPIGTYSGEITPPLGYLMVHSTNMTKGKNLQKKFLFDIQVMIRH